MANNSRLSSTIRSQRRPIGRMNGKRASHRRQPLQFCEHGRPINRCHKKNCGMTRMGDDGSAMAGGAMT